MATSWTPERKAKASELIHKWEPWERSTGPKTKEGKERVSQNGYKGGTWKTMIELARSLREQERLLRELK